MQPETCTGSCHCGAIRFEVAGRPTRVIDCDCSICRKTGFLHWIVGESQVRILDGAGAIATYRWGTGTARHHFCPTCGVAPLRRPRLDPSSWSVNARCLDGIDLDALEREPCDGRSLPLPGG